LLELTNCNLNLNKYEEIKNNIEKIKDSLISQNSIIKNYYNLEISNSNVRSLSRSGKFINDDKEIVIVDFSSNENLINSKKEISGNYTIIKREKIEYKVAKRILRRIKIILNIKKANKGAICKSVFEYKEILYGKNLKYKLNNRDDLKLDENYDLITDEDKNKNKNEKIENVELVYKNYKKFAVFIEDIEEYIKQEDIKFNPQIILEIEKEKIMNENNLYYLTCIYTFYNQMNNNEKMTFRDENILVNSIKGKCEGFFYLMNELSNDDYIGANFIYKDI
jgi:hypothetical protein